MQHYTRLIRQVLGLGIFCLTLSACGGADDGAPDYRYRLTVEVETPEGLRTGSSVIEVKQSLTRAAGSPAHSAVQRRARGEAVAVDLPGGRTLFALLRSEDSVDWATYVMQNTAPKIRGETFEEKFDNMLLIKGEKVLPRYWPPYGPGRRKSGYPMLVTFGDMSDPTSVELVDPDDLAATFGEGSALKRVTVQMTNDPVSEEIEKRLGWLDAHGREHARLKPSGSRYLDEAQFINLVTPGDFSTELYK